MKKYDPTKSTKAQREYLKNICRDLKIKFDGKLMNRSQVSKFIDCHKMEHRKYVAENNLPVPPTNKQKKFIKAIEKHLDELWTGETFEEAKEFLEEWAQVFYEHKEDMIEQGIWKRREWG